MCLLGSNRQTVTGDGDQNIVNRWKVRGHFPFGYLGPLPTVILQQPPPPTQCERVFCNANTSTVQISRVSEHPVSQICSLQFHISSTS